MIALDTVLLVITIVILSVFVALLVIVAFLNDELNHRARFLLAFSGGAVAAWITYITSWWASKYEQGYFIGLQDEAGSNVVIYTPRALNLSFVLTAGAVLGAGLVALGILKAYELLRSLKTDEKKE